MANILLIEPDYNNKYPPLGLMKISYFHKFILNDYVRFTKGKLPESLSHMKWDRVYVTSLFTFEWAKTIEAIEYAKTLVDSIDKVIVGGIAATMLPDDFQRETGIRPVCGLLNEPGKLGLKGDECIDGITPDYSILEDIDYVYPFHDAYFLSATKGCGHRCEFCAVQLLEPSFIPYMNIKEKVKLIDEKYGKKKDLLLMDNNVLRSPRFNEIIDDIIEAGFGRGASYTNPKTGKTVMRSVDFNQGLDALFFTDEKVKRLSEIALRPARVAFDHIEDKEVYERALRLCAKYGIDELSNYVLFNSDSFMCKGRRYAADKPEDLYDRMKFTIDLKDELNLDRDKDNRVSAFSFPMRYIPLNAHERGYISGNWNAKFLRAVTRMLIPTQGKGVGSRSFFEAAFGKDTEEYMRFLCMPETLLAARGKFSSGGRGRKNETEEECAARKAEWIKNQDKIAEWNRQFDELGSSKADFIDIIGDNEFLPEKVLMIQNDQYRKLYLLYLTMPRLVSLLGMIDRESPTYLSIFDYLTNEFSLLYKEIVEFVATNDNQQQYIFKNFYDFFGKDGLRDLLRFIKAVDFDVDKQLQRWTRICKKNNYSVCDFELIRIYRRYVELNCLNEVENKTVQNAFVDLDMEKAASVLFKKNRKFESRVMNEISTEIGGELLKKTSSTIVSHIQMKLKLVRGK